MTTISQTEHTTEDITAVIIQSIFQNCEIIRNKQVPNSNIKTRPDFYIPSEQLIIEFDGYQHYNTSSVILRDRLKDVRYGEMGIKIIRIPYFVQLTRSVQQILFNDVSSTHVVYPHGFINNKALLPADFCELGIKRFVQDLNDYEFIAEEIILSLVNKINTASCIEEVLPPSLFYLAA